jgi:DNA mismatch repair protein MutL
VPKVTVLPPELASQIAAGEVVERPASAVKELVENALDAGAQRVDVEIEGGGVTLMRVRDDGAGMSPEDALLAIQRHATSKLRSIEDLRTIASFGFRGEALPTIASVSRFSLRTRSREHDTGVEIVVAGTAAPEARPASAAPGTVIEVRDLFFNVPARRKFLRSSGTEAGHVVDTVEGLALASPGVTLTVSRDGRRVREWLRASSREERVHAVEEETIACRGERGPLMIEAFLTRPEQARTGASGLRLLVNGRSIRDRALALSVAQAYGSVLERGRYPRGVVYLDLPFELVDVNVHPQKAEVRFADPRAVNDALYSVLAKALASALALPVPSRGRWTPAAQPAPAAPPTLQEAAAVTPAPSATGEPDPWGLFGGLAAPTSPPASASSHEPTHVERSSAVATEAATVSNATAPSSPRLTGREPVSASGALWSVGEAAAPAPLRDRSGVAWHELTFIAQVRQTYLVCEGADGLYVLDQHAAAERVLFHRLRAAFLSRTVATQALLFPLALEVSTEEAGFVEAHADALLALGVDLRTRGARTVTLHAVPRLLERSNPEELARGLLAELCRSGGRAFSEAIDLALAQLACHGSVRAGDPLTREEAEALLRALDDVDFSGFCPHGRPVVMVTPWGELERKVGRR